MTAARPCLIAIAAALLAGCGQKGPLYLPGDPGEIRQPVPPVEASPAPGDEPEDDDGQ